MNELLFALKSNHFLLISSVAFLSLFIGSFLNVVIYRLPIMMKRSWTEECYGFLEKPLPDGYDPTPFNLMVPRSRCPHCQSLITAKQNIPVISYLLLKGNCQVCHTKISYRYPLIELLTALLSGVVAWQLGYGLPLLCALPLTWCLITLSLIDYDELLLPDCIVMPLIWMGLLINLQSVFIDSRASIIGAVSGYLSLWTVFHLFRLVTGKEGMGYGDFKLMALFGAWLGWSVLPQIIMLSAVAGTIIGISLVLIKKHAIEKPIPFGPYIAIAGWAALLWGEQINSLYFLMIN